MNAAQKIHYIQSEYDEWDRKQCAITQRQLEIINNLKTDGFTGSRFFPSDTVKDIIYDAIDANAAALMTAMYMAMEALSDAKEIEDKQKAEQAFRDASFAAGNHLVELVHAKAYELAEEDINEKESF